MVHLWNGHLFQVDVEEERKNSTICLLSRRTGEREKRRRRFLLQNQHKLGLEVMDLGMSHPEHVIVMFWHFLILTKNVKTLLF